MKYLAALIFVAGFLIASSVLGYGTPSPESIIPAKKSSSSESDKMTVNRRIQLITQLVIAVNRGKIATVKSLLDEGADINAEDDHGVSVLDYAIIDNRLDVAKLLIKRGANINSKDHTGSTILFYAIYFGKIDIARFLIENGIDVNMKDNDGYTALDLAKIKGFKDFVQILKKAGAR